VRARTRGFSLIETLMGAALVALLAAMGYPSYAEQVQLARRADAWDALARLALAQERHRSRNTTFAGDLDALGQPPHSPAQHYRVRVSTADAEGYVLEAWPSPGSSQAGDLRCQRLRVTVQRGVLQHASYDRQGQDSTRRCFVS